MNIQFQLFAKARELVDQSSVMVRVNSVTPSSLATLQDAIHELQHQYPQLSSDFLNKCRFAHNNTYVRQPNSLHLNANDVFVIIPPISGG